MEQTTLVVFPVESLVCSDSMLGLEVLDVGKAFGLFISSVERDVNLMV